MNIKCIIINYNESKIINIFIIIQTKKKNCNTYLLTKKIYVKQN